MEIRSDREFHFNLARPELWRVLTVVEDYPRWWPWLRRFDARALAPGESWTCRIRPPAPYPIRCWLHLGSVVEPELITAELTGDLTGRARVDLHDGEIPGTTRVRLRSELTAVAGPVWLASRAFPRLAHRAHDWIVDAGARQFGAAWNRFH